MRMAEDEERAGRIFTADAEVTADGEALLLPPEAAARWKPPEKHQTEHIGPARGQR